MKRVVTGDIIRKVLVRLRNVKNVALIIPIVEHLNGALNIVAGGRRAFVTLNRSVPSAMHHSGRVENKTRVN